MAFGKIYYYTFKDNDEQEYTVEIWKDGFSGTTQLIKGDTSPFNVNYPTTTNKLQTIRGAGCDLNLLSETSMKFVDLYIIDMLQVQIKLYKGSNMIWLGYLNSELYSEPFNEYDNYSVALTGTDGLALLERLDFLQDDGSIYTGFSDNWTIVKNILQKLNLDWNNIYVGLSTTSPEITQTSTENILERTYSLLENYYDEDGVAMNCREVLEVILKAFGAYIQIINGNVYITDNNLIAGAPTPPPVTTTTTTRPYLYAHLYDDCVVDYELDKYVVGGIFNDKNGFNSVPLVIEYTEFTEVQSVSFLAGQEFVTDLTPVFINSTADRTLEIDFDIDVEVTNGFGLSNKDALDLRYSIYDGYTLISTTSCDSETPPYWVNPFGQHSSEEYRKLKGTIHTTITTGQSLYIYVKEKYVFGSNGRAFFRNTDIKIKQNL